MTLFETFFRLGLRHIADIQAYDHLLFIITLCASYRYIAWQRILVLVTAFTIGHSLTLAASVLDLLRIDSALIELLIPITIALTAIHNIVSYSDNKVASPPYRNYGLALFFGFIHGMGFSNYLRSITSGPSHLLKELFAFNVGIEVGQLLIVLVFFTLYWVLDKVFRIQQRDWNLFWSGGGFAVSITLLLSILLE